MAPPKRRQIWLVPLGLLGTTTAVVFFGLFLADWVTWSPVASKPSPLLQLFHFDPDTAQNALGNLAQVIAAVLGIVITVVSIVVQLASTRYTPRIADMFFRDRTNLAVLGFFVVAGIDAVWVSLSVTHEFIPRISITASLLMVSMSILLMVPYFAYVFAFLDPEKIVARIQQQALASALHRGDSDEDIDTRQTRVLGAIEQLADVAMNAISQKDKLIAQGAIDALKELAVSYLQGKSSAPEGKSWFEIGARLRQNPDFVSMSRESVDDLAQRQVWVEWKVLRQYQAIYNEALAGLPDMNYLLAIDSRYIGDAAIAFNDREVLALVLKFFNTYLRATLNAEQVRTAYNVLNQYRQLGENVLVAAGQKPALDAVALEIAGYLRYYGQLAHSMQLRFVSETVAYDLATLCERAFKENARCHEAILRVLLTLDREAETGAQEQMLRGVRKAQVKLATFYLAAGAESHARLIAADMRDEQAMRLRSIRDELLAVTSRDFWEVIDRGTNFDYLDDERKRQLHIFFGWFPSMDAPATANG